MRAGLRHCSVVALALLATARTTSADAPPPTRLEYRAPSSCPPASEFEKRLHARAPRVRLVPGSSAPRTLFVEIVRRADGMFGTLRIVESGGGDRRRSLKAARCDDTVDGLALVAAVALDPEGPMSGTSDRPDTAPAPSPPPAAPPESPVPATPSVPTPPSPPPNAMPIPDQPSGDARARRDDGELQEDAWHLLVGVGAGGLFGHAPGALPAFTFLAGAEWYVSPFWAPSIRASFIQTGEREFIETNGHVQFRATMGMIEFCPFRFGPPQLAFRPCFAGDGGVATISGSQTLNAESHTTWRWHLGASGLMGLGVSKRITVTAAAGLLIPLSRDQVQFKPSTVFFSDPAVSEFVRLDVTVAFP